MKIGVPVEVYPGERRVAATPEALVRLKKLGFDVLIQRGAGEKASFLDRAYEDAGAHIVETARELWAQSQVILKVRAPMLLPSGEHEADWLDESKALISFIWPAQNPELLEKLAASRACVWAMDAVPRISRAQRMDALSSMANIAGYRAVVEAAQHFGRFFTGQITAAGKVPPAKVLVIGAGVAGLAAIGAARGLGAIVRAFDTRPAVKEQVQSMGAEFLELNYVEDGTGEGGYAREMSPAFIAAEMDLFRKQAADVDIIITTALIPGKPAPKLLPLDVIDHLKPGSVVVDLAAEQGGNCAQTVRGQVVVVGGVSYVGYDDLPSRMAAQSSQLYATNLCHMLDELGGMTKISTPDLDNEIIRGALIARGGDVLWPPPKREPSPQAPAQASPRPSARQNRPACRPHPIQSPTKIPRRPHQRRRSKPYDTRRSRHRDCADWLGRAACIFVSLYGLCIGVFCGLAGGLECRACAAHALDERHQRDQRHHFDCGSCAGLCRLHQPCDDSWFHRHFACDGERCGWFFGHPTYAQDVSPLNQNTSNKTN